MRKVLFAGIRTQQHEVITISFFPMKRWQWGQLMKILLGKAYITGRRSPRKRSVLKKRKEGVRMPVSVADANVCSTLHMHLGHPTLANRPGHDVFEEQDRVRRHVARQMEFAAGDRGNTVFCIRSEIQIWLWEFKTGVIHQVAGNGRSITKLVLPEKENPSGRRRRPFQLNLHYQRKKIHLVAGDGCSITSHVLGENENPSCCWRRPFQY